MEAAAAASHAALAAAEAAIDGELAGIGPAAPRSSPGSTPAHLDRYERLRARLGGVAVARLDGNRCGGCHLDLSTAELADVRAVELADCPQCGRMLVP